MGFNTLEILVPPGDAAMRLRITLGFFVAGMVILLVGPDSFGQGKGFGFPQGGTPGEAPAAGGGVGRFFDMLAKGKDAIVISEAPVGMKDTLAEYAQASGISSGEITRDQWTGYIEFAKTKKAARTGIPGAAPPTITIPGAGPAGGLPPGATPEMLTLWADADFKRFDENGDGKLNEDEMPKQLRKELARWDKNQDGLIDQEEYRNYFLTTFQERLSGSAASQKQNPFGSPLEDDLDKRPVVYRAGKLPTKGMPLWFKQLDTDGDGQIALYEWRQAGKNLDEFKFWDRDDDGFITIEEALHVNAALMKTADPLLASADSTPQGFPGMGGQFGGNTGQFGGKNGPFGASMPGGGQFPGFGGGNRGGGQFPGFGGGNRGGNPGGGQFPGFGGNPPGGQPGGKKGGGKKSGGNPNDGN
jgi:Ca2+-binding EF-hand superfamily protein